MRVALTARTVAVGLSCAALGALLLSGAAHAVVDTVFKYKTPKTGYVMIPAAAFIPRYNTLTYDIVDFISNTANGVNTCFSAPVSLPQGAKMTALAVWHRSGASDMTIVFDRLDLATGAIDTILNKTLPDTSSAWKAASYVLSTVAENRQHTYTAYVCLSNASNLFGALRIAFTYDNAGY